MQFEERQRNDQPREAGSKSLPMTVLFILVGIICLLLFIGWQYLADTPSNAEEMVPSQPDAVASTMEKEQNATDQDVDMKVDESMASNTATATQPTTTEAPTTKPEPAKPAEPVKEEKKAAPAPPPTGGQTHMHSVGSGETFFSIASRYNVSTETLKSYNPGVTPEAIKEGSTTLKVPVQAVHTVGPGDILRVVAEKYNISVQALMKANGKTKNHSQRGEKLIIPVSK